MESKIKLSFLIWLIRLILLPGQLVYSTNLNDTTSFKIDYLKIYPCKKGKNTVKLVVTNHANEKLIFALHIQSNIRISSSVGRGWGTVFFDTIPSGIEKMIEHSFPFYSDLDDGITLRLQYYQLEESEEWNFNNYFYRKTYNHQDISEICSQNISHIEISEVDIYFEFNRIRSKLKNNHFKDVWNSFTRSYQEAQYQGEINSFESKVIRPQPFDYWNTEQFLQLVPQESLKLKDGRILLNLLFGSNPWRIYFKYSDNQWKIDWIDGFTTLVDLWMTWPERLLPNMQLVSTEHFDFHYEKDSYPEKNIEDIVRIREDGYKKICEYLHLDTDQRIATVFFNDFETKAFETGHRGKGAAFDTTVIEVYNEDIQAHPFHETVHILTNSIGFPPALFIEGLAEYLEIVLVSEDSLELSNKLENQIINLKNSTDWIPIKELITFTDIPGPSQAHVSYPEAAAFVKFLIEKYGKQKFKETYKHLLNSDSESIAVKNMEKLEVIYGKSIDILIEEFHSNYQ
jgi:hypothetical protein